MFHGKLNTKRMGMSAEACLRTGGAVSMPTRAVGLHHAMMWADRQVVKIWRIGVVVMLLKGSLSR